MRDRIFHSKCTLHLNVVESQGGDIKNHSNETSLVGGLHSAKLFRRILQGGGETVIGIAHMQMSDHFEPIFHKYYNVCIS